MTDRKQPCGTCGGSGEVQVFNERPGAGYGYGPCPDCQPPDQPGCICGDLGLANEMYRKHCPVHAQPTTAEPLAREAYRESQRQWCDHKPNSSVCEDCAVKPITAALDAMRREAKDEAMGEYIQTDDLTIDARQQAFREVLAKVREIRKAGLITIDHLEPWVRGLAGEES